MTDTSTTDQAWCAWQAGTLPTLPGLLGDIWRDGYQTAVAKLKPPLDAAEREADRWYYIARNPQAEREQTTLTLQLMATAAARARDTWRRHALDKLEADDPVVYAGCIRLMTEGRTADADQVLHALSGEAVPA